MTNREFRRFTYKACIGLFSIPTVRVYRGPAIYKTLYSSLSLEALKMYCVMRASTPFLYNVYHISYPCPLCIKGVKFVLGLSRNDWTSVTMYLDKLSLAIVMAMGAYPSLRSLTHCNRIICMICVQTIIIE